MPTHKRKVDFLASNLLDGSRAPCRHRFIKPRPSRKSRKKPEKNLLEQQEAQKEQEKKEDNCSNEVLAVLVVGD